MFHAVEDVTQEKDITTEESFGDEKLGFLRWLKGVAETEVEEGRARREGKKKEKKKKSEGVDPLPSYSSFVFC